MRSNGYHADKSICLSRSVIHTLLYQSAFHAWWNHPGLNPDFVETEDAKFDLGTATHSLLLEGVDCCVVIKADDWRTKAAKEAREEARTTGKTPLLEKQYDSAIAMVESAEKQIKECKELKITDLRSEGACEKVYKWTEGDIQYKLMLDWIKHDRSLICDYKTTGISANPSDFGRSIIAHGLDIQESLYRRGVKAVDGIEPKFVFLVQETEPPYLMSFIGLPPEFQAMGESKIIKGSILWQQCLESNQWPAYPKRIAYIDPPTWSMMQWEEIAERIGI